MPTPRRLTSTITALALAGVALAACGSGATTTSTGSTTTEAPAATTPATAAPVTTAQAAGTPLITVGAVPAVSGATDLAKEPVIAAGTGTAPTVPTGKDLVVGTGAVASATDMVTIRYVGSLFSTGKVFDASWTDGSGGPVTFGLDQVIPGFKDAIVGMRIGGRREIVIPPADGYGAAGSPPAVPGNATLVFVIDLVAIAPGQ